MGDDTRLGDDAIALIASELSQGYLSEETNKILTCLARNGNAMNQTELQKESGLSYTICREAILLLTGAIFIKPRQQGLSKMYQLTPTGVRLIQLLKGGEG